jgi:hypothetical protein
LLDLLILVVRLVLVLVLTAVLLLMFTMVLSLSAMWFTSAVVWYRRHHCSSALQVDVNATFVLLASVV